MTLSFYEALVVMRLSREGLMSNCYLRGHGQAQGHRLVGWSLFCIFLRVLRERNEFSVFFRLLRVDRLAANLPFLRVLCVLRERNEFPDFFRWLRAVKLAANLPFLRVLRERNVFPDFAVGFALIG